MIQATPAPPLGGKPADGTGVDATSGGFGKIKAESKQRNVSYDTLGCHGRLVKHTAAWCSSRASAPHTEAIVLNTTVGSIPNLVPLLHVLHPSLSAYFLLIKATSAKEI
ncbi:hypothetical protein ATANTOWER_022960 [Ataeniobius toweri]|uniref:Uncharacterized protein n=1 Tax=Ataeniobius toweri TaxID=208326 RepID=A0ABU7BUR3_9TELE|nr:hypothetical protein [Ataeniobius toweri]